MQIIDIRQSIYDNNDREAALLRDELCAQKTFLLNLMASPGAGKTTTLRRVLPLLRGEFKIGVLQADIDSDVDARALAEDGFDAVQLHTGGMCHLDAGMTRQGLEAIGSERYDLIVLENVGNLVCPAEFDTGAVKNAAILSVPEGDDKPLKYPLMFQVANLLVINKTDTLGVFDFDVDKACARARRRNPEIEILCLSAKTGEGVDRLADWLRREVRAWIA